MSVEHNAQVSNQPIETPPDGSALINLIARAAKDPNVDLSKMERLFEMHERITSKRSEELFNTAMAATQAGLLPVVRRSVNSHTRSKYAALDTIAAACMPVITSHGFGLSFGTEKTDQPDYITVYCDVTHAGGFCKRYSSDIPIDAAGTQGKTNKTKVQAFGSTTTYGRRYVMMMAFNIATTDDSDGQSCSGTPITEQQVDIIRKKIEEVGADIPSFCGHFKIDKIGDLQASAFNRVMTALERKGEAK